MTQFMLCVPDPKAALSHSQLELRRVASDPWLAEIAGKVYAGELDVRVPFLPSGRTIDDLFTESHNALYNGREFGDTQLKSILPELLDRCRSFAVWWGDEWHDLPLIEDEAVLITELQHQLAQPVGDVYLRWKRSR